MEYRVLGKLEVVRDGQAIELGAFRQRALLGLLLTAPNSVFSTDRILDELWGADGGIDKQNALWVYVSGLRKALEPDRAKRTDGTILLTRSPGYLVQASPEQVDALRFERMVGEGRGLIDVDPGPLKTYMELAGMPVGPVRLPLQGPSSATLAGLKTAVQQAKAVNLA